MPKRWCALFACALPFLFSAPSPILGEGVIEEWLVLGVFPYGEGQERLAVDSLGGEQDVVPHEGAVISGKRWKRMQVDYKGKLDFIGPGGFGDTEMTVCYAHTFVMSPVERNALLLVGSDDAVRIYVNGIEVHYHDIPRGWRPDQDTVVVRIGAGWNRVMAKVANGVGDFALSARLVDEEGKAIEEILFQAENPAREGRFETIRVSPWLRIEKLTFSGFALERGDLRLVLTAEIKNLGTVNPSTAVVRMEGLPHRMSIAQGEHVVKRYPSEEVAFVFSPDEVTTLAEGDARLTVGVSWDAHHETASIRFQPWEILDLFFAGIDLRAWRVRQGCREGEPIVDFTPPDWSPYDASESAGAFEGTATFGQRFTVPRALSGYPLTLTLSEPYERSRLWIDGTEQTTTNGGFQLGDPVEADQSFTMAACAESLQVERPFRAAVTPSSPSFSTMSTNGQWASVFTQDRMGLTEKTGARLLVAALKGSTSEFTQLVEEENNRLLTVSPAIKACSLHVVGNAHIDMAWLWPWSETVDVCRMTFERVLSNMNRYPDYVYAQSQAQAYVWMEERYPEIFEEIRRRVEEGRWLIVGGTWVEPDNNLPSGESQVRQILYGKRYFRERFGVDVNIAWLPDSFGYAWTLPQIYRKSGFQYFITQKLTWNDTNEFPHKVFYWQGPDSSQLFSYFPYTYTHNLDPHRLASHFVDYEKRTGLKDQLVLYGEGDHGGGPSEEMIERVAQLQEIDTFPTVVHDTPNHFLRALEKEGTPLPVWNDELYLEYHRGCYTTQARIKKRNRRCEALLETAEKFASFTHSAYPSRELESAWKRTLFNQFHDILPGSSIPQVYVDAHRDYDEIEASLGNILHRSLKEICGRIETEGEGTPIVVFNPLSWTRRGVVEAVLPGGPAGDVAVFDRRGHRIPSQMYEDTLVFVADSVPSVGYETFWLRSGSEEAERPHLQVGSRFIENELYRIEINPNTGNWSRLYDKRHGRELFEPGREGNLLQAFEDLPDAWDAWNIGYTGTIWDVEDVENIEVVERGPVRARLRITRTFGTSRFVQDVILYDRLPRIDVMNDVEWKESHILLKAAFPANVKSDVATYEIPYGTITRRTVPITPQDSAKFEVSSHTWIDLSDGTCGLSLLNDCKYGHDVRGNLMRITLLRSPEWPDPHADVGHHTFTYSLYPHAGEWRQALTHRRGHELNSPLIAVLESPHSGQLPSRGSFAAVRPEGVVLSVIKKAEDGDDLVLRLYELFGQKRRAEIDLSLVVRGAFESDLLEKPHAKLETKDKTVFAPTNPYEIKTITVQFSPEQSFH